MADNTLIVQIDFEKGDVSGVFKEVGKDAQKVGKKTGKKFGKGFESGASRILKTATKITAAFAAIASALTLKESIQSAIKQEEAVQSLNTSLALAGTFSRQASQDIQDFASQLQKTTTVGDEVTLSMFSLARNMTKTNEEAKKLTLAATELSAATGLSLESSVKNLGKTFGGLTGELGESLPIIKELTVEQLKAGEALDFVINRFGGAAAGKVNTFSGAIKQLSNAFGDSLEEQGFFITKSPILIAVIQKISQFFSKSAAATKKFREEVGDIFKPISNVLIGIANFVNTYLVQPFERAFFIIKGVLSNLFGGLMGAKDGVQSAFGGISDIIRNVINKIIGYVATIAPVIEQFFDKAFAFISEKASIFATEFMAILAKGIQFIKPFVTQIAMFIGGLLQETTGGFDNVIEKLITKIEKVLVFLRPVLEKLGVDVDSAVAGVRSTIENMVPEGDTLEEKFANLGEKFGNFKDIAAEKLAEIKAIIKDSISGAVDTPLTEAITARLAELQRLVDESAPIGEQFKNNIKAGTDGVKKELSDMSKAANKIMNAGFARAISGGIQSVIQSISKGEDVFANFGKFLLGMFGDLAIQLGEFYIAAGLANLALITTDPTAQIATGAALVALGGILKSFAGGGEAGASAGAGGGAGFATQPGELDSTEPEDLEAAAKATQVNITVEGSLVQQEELGAFLQDTINEANEKNGIVQVNPRFA